MNEPIHDDSPATEAETRAFLLARSKRTITPILKDFVQKPRGSTDRSGPLSTFVRNRDLRGLQAFLFLLSINSNGPGPDGWSTTLSIPVWARALDLTRDASEASAATAVSKVLTRLEQRKLIERDRRGRERKIRATLLREDGSGQPYTRPGSAGNSDRYLQLPHTYWLDDWFQKLDLPSTAMLLVALHEKPIFHLPTENMPNWYGWSAATAERGFTILERHGLISKATRFKKAPLSPSGLAKINEYTLTGPFNRSLLAVPKSPSARPRLRRIDGKHTKASV
ncbi:MAG: hypothetical protein QOE23_1467 [Pseudonocardiales bacterium]|nr:hypothetical protein [Pseudonocardiales bacterium]